MPVEFAVGLRIPPFIEGEEIAPGENREQYINRRNLALRGCMVLGESQEITWQADCVLPPKLKVALGSLRGSDVTLKIHDIVPLAHQQVRIALEALLGTSWMVHLVTSIKNETDTMELVRISCVSIAELDDTMVGTRSYYNEHIRQIPISAIQQIHITERDEPKPPQEDDSDPYGMFYGYNM